MKSHTIISQYENFKIPIQVITLKDSFFVYIGTSELNFENLIVSLSCGDVILNLFSMLIHMKFMKMSTLRLGRV
jgi:hypothetical protein